MPASLDPALAPLVGSWRLLSASATFTDTGERTETFGPNPSGHVVITAGGRIMFLIMRSDRRTPVSDAERAALFDGMISYTGRIRLAAPGQFITTVDVSLIPSEVGGEKRRLFTVEGDRLTIRLPEGVSRFSRGRNSMSELVWEREHRPVRLSGTENRHKAIQKSHAEVGFLRGLRPPSTTVSGSEKSYRPRKLRWRQISGERWAMSSLWTSMPSFRTWRMASCM
jgi:Lipocalin-like domain